MNSIINLVLKLEKFDEIAKRLELVEEFINLDDKLFSKIIEGHVNSDGLVLPNELDKIIDNYTCYKYRVESIRPGTILKIESERSKKSHKFLVLNVEKLEHGRLSVYCLDKNNTTLYLDETQIYDSIVLGELNIKFLLE